MDYEDQIIHVKISDIKVNAGLSENLIEEEVERIADSIDEFGIIIPIMLDKDYNIIAGRHRLEASIRKGKDTIRSVFIETEDRHEIEIIENSFRRSISIKEKVSYATYLEKKYKATRGRPSKEEKNNLSQLRKISSSIEMVIKYGVFKNKDEFYRASNIVAKGVPSLIKAVDDGFYSLSVANQIANLPSDVQEQQIIDDENAIRRSSDDATDNAKKRRKAKRNAKKMVPVSHNADPIFGLVRIAPDFWTESNTEIAETPISDYINPTTGVLVIECPNQFIDRAISLLSDWGLNYKATITIWTKKSPEETHLDYVNRQVFHLIIGRVDPEVDPGFEFVDPVFDRQDHAEAMDDIIGKIWPDEDIVKIDMTSIKSREGWSTWKIDYAPESPDNDGDDPESSESPDESEESDE